jgi:hypothetical protein
VCEDELNKVVAETKESRRSLKYKVKIDELATSNVKIILNECDEGSKMDAAEAVSSSSINNPTHLQKCKKLLFSMAQKTTKNHLFNN